VHQSLRELSDTIEALEERRLCIVREARIAFRQAIVDCWTFQQILDTPDNAVDLVKLKTLEEAFIASSTKYLDTRLASLNASISRMHSSIDLRACTFEDISNPSVNLPPLNKIA
jgi:hypothetical protein